MISKISRFLIALALVLSVLGLSTTTALAEKPIKTVYQDFVLTNTGYGLCDFPVTSEATFDFISIFFVDNNGAPLKELDQVTETDVFSANGKTLVGLPYHYSIKWIFDSDGNVSHEFVSGGGFRIQLPDGTLLTAAGRMDVMTHPGQAFYLPDVGHVSDLTAFCAALAP